MLMGRFSSRIYIAYCTFYILGQIMAMQIPFVGMQPVRTSEHMAAAGPSPTPSQSQALG